MRILICAAIAGAIAAASPAVAQNNAAAAANTAQTNEAAPLNAMTSMPAGPTTAGGQPTTLPPTVTTANEAGTAPIVASKPGFPWGVLGLLGLIGLFGRRRSS
jgi:MYXO-CTERM domain-containing protein